MLLELRNHLGVSELEVVPRIDLSYAQVQAHADADPTTLDRRPVAGAVAATLAGAVAIAVAGALRGTHERALAFSDDGRAERGADLWTGPPAYT